MSNSNVEAEVILQEKNQELDLHDEFEKLRPKPYTTLIALVAFLVFYIIDNTLLEELNNWPILVYAGLLYFVMEGYNQSINKRIDVMYKLLLKKIDNA